MLGIKSPSPSKLVLAGVLLYRQQPVAGQVEGSTTSLAPLATPCLCVFSAGESEQSDEMETESGEIESVVSMRV